MTCPPYYLILWDEYLIITLHIIANRITKIVRKIFVTDQFSVKFTSIKADKMGFLENQDGGWMMEHRVSFFLNKKRTRTSLGINFVHRN